MPTEGAHARCQEDEYAAGIESIGANRRQTRGHRLNEPKDRTGKILVEIDRDMRVLEIGPSYSPVAPKRDGWNTTTVDHASREQLAEKYRDERVDVSLIEDVDFLWTEGPLDAAVPRELHGAFDACIASHVLEHLPDPIGLLESLERLLTADGLLSLALPDKRFCFDFFKPLTSVGELLDAHGRRATRHSLKTGFDMKAYSIRSAGEHAWAPRVVDDVTFYKPFEELKRDLQVLRETADGPYVDHHAWHFTPSSFELAILELSALEEVDFRIDRSFPTERYEFYVTLRRGRAPVAPGDVDARRLELLHATLVEVREQTAYLPEVANRPDLPQAANWASQPRATEEPPRRDVVPAARGLAAGIRGAGRNVVSAASGLAADIRWHVRARTRARRAASAVRQRLRDRGQST
jgi:SAM-dependent methyltransferase